MFRTKTTIEGMMNVFTLQSCVYFLAWWIALVAVLVFQVSTEESEPLYAIPALVGSAGL